MSLVSMPQQEVVYDVDNSCQPAKLTLTFREPVKEPSSHSIETPAPTVQKPIARVITKPERKMEEPAEEPREKFKNPNQWNNLKKARDHFLEKGAIKALLGTVEQKVQCACMSIDHLLEEKRKKLRELLLAEEVAYTAEYVALCQQANANREQELRDRAFEVKTKAERERKLLAEQKLLEQKVLSCDPARPVLTQKHLKEIKQDQLWQIKEKYAREEARREEDRMYHDILIKDMIAVKENDEENAKLAWMKQKEAQKAFVEQMKRKEQKEEEERQLKEYERLQLEQEIRLIKEENEKETGSKMQKKAALKAEIREQLEKEREWKDRRKREEKEIDRTFFELLKIEEEKEKRKEASNKERLKKEMDIFLEKSKELRLQKEEEERKCEKMLEELNEKKRIQIDTERRRLKAAREELFYSVLRGREEQVKAKQERLRREEEQEKRELELLTLQMEQQRKIREEYERRCAEQRELYKCQLLEQIKECEEAKKKKKEEEDAYMRMKKAEEEKEIEEVKAIMRDLPISSKDHPMKAIVKEIPPRFACPHPCPR